MLSTHNRDSKLIQDAQTFSSKAAKAEFSRNYDQAFGLYVQAAESFLHLSRSGGYSDDLKNQWKSKAAKAVERAEKIKRFMSKTTPSSLRKSPVEGETSNMGTRLTPVRINHFSTFEQTYVLKRGELVNGHSFPLWDDPPSFGTVHGTEFSDPDGQPKLSPDQLKVSPVWRRCRADAASPTQRPVLPQEILQHIVTDCSLCASISVCLDHTRRFGSHLAESSLHILSPMNGSKVLGRCDVRVLFNGAWRRIVIDDKLPYNPVDGSLMCMTILPDNSSPLVTDQPQWPSLLEKAYMKLMGGYDFPGSNSSADLHAVAGWIPEHIEMRRYSFERERSWHRIFEGFTSGKCVVTLGTSDNPRLKWRDVDLLASHSYAVINVYEAEEGRIFTVLDSWVRNQEEKHEPSRILEVPWAEVVNVFDSIYLSWDPAIWAHSINFHGMWKRNGAEEEGTRHLSVQFSAEENFDDEVWVVLTRHVVDSLRTVDFISLRVDVEDDAIPISATLDDGQHISAKTTYTNNIHVLARTRIPPNQRSGIMSILASYDGPAKDVGFTLVVLAKEGVKVSWIEDPPPLVYTEKAKGEITTLNAGGNCKYPTFMLNPQYHLSISAPQERTAKINASKANISFSLRTGKDLPVNLTAVWSNGQRVAELPEKDVVVTSGAYTYGSARAHNEFAPGEYTIVISAFEPFQMGRYNLAVECSLPFELKPIPPEGAGMYSKVVKGAWESATAAGGPSFDKYWQNPIYEIVVPSSAKLMARLQLLNSTSTVPLNLTIYSDAPDQFHIPNQRLTTNGAYDDAVAGVVTPAVSVGAGKYYLVPSTYAPGTEVGFKLIIYSTISTLNIRLLPRSP